ncbi:MAG: adenylate/guanylate cyclase domain-containing protein [Ferrovibrio sp.]|uniref:adenylate/guanylate cyclase domain-containing protein n=1 Tax=Ferrovibrio sp. TaxID=1917215 RepID=UPI00391A5F9D
MRLWQQWHDLICGKGEDCLPDPASDRLNVAIRQEEFEALRLTLGLRLGVCAIVAVILTVEMGWPLAFNYYGYLGAFAFSAYLQMLLRKPDLDQPWMHWLFPFIDMALLTGAIVLPNPFDPTPLPPPMQLGFDTILYVALFVVLSALGQSARTVLLTTLAAIVCWTAGTLYILMQPGVSLSLNLDNIIGMPVPDRIAYILDPWSVRLGEFLPRLILIGMIGILLAVAVMRSRHLIARQVESERARRNLSRHFSPHIAQQIEQMDDAIGQVKSLNAAVLFADLVGFTQIADDHTPEQTVTILREVHQRLGRAVHENGGTLDKYLGDGIMASFGTPQAGQRDASSALLAARAMLREMDHLNRQRALLRQVPLHLAVGVHFGPLTLGNIGDESRVEFALIGETVNVAHRLEQMTRSLNAQLCLSQAFIDKLVDETRGDLGAVRDMVTLKPQPIRGLRDRMVLWILPRQPLGSEADAPKATPTIH